MDPPVAPFVRGRPPALCERKVTSDFSHLSRVVTGAFANLGLDLRFELRPTKRVTPYATASAIYLHNRASIDPAARLATIRDLHAARFGAGLGLRTGLTDRLSIFAEGRVTRLAFDDLVNITPTGRSPLDVRTRFQAGFGFTFRLK